MFKRYDLDVTYSSVPIYAGSFSSINHMVKFACGFDNTICDFVAFDTVMERHLPIEELVEEFRSDCYGI